LTFKFKRKRILLSEKRKNSKAIGYARASHNEYEYLDEQIKILKEAGLIADRQECRWVYYSLNKESLFLIKEWITSLTDYSSNRNVVANKLYFRFY